MNTSIFILDNQNNVFLGSKSYFVWNRLLFLYLVCNNLPLQLTIFTKKYSNYLGYFLYWETNLEDLMLLMFLTALLYIYRIDILNNKFDVYVCVWWIIKKILIYFEYLYKYFPLTGCSHLHFIYFMVYLILLTSIRLH